MKTHGWMVLAAGGLLCAGCARIRPFVQDPELAAYGMTYRKRPQAIKDALAEKRLAEGMTRREVELCWGTPHRKRRVRIDGVKAEIWHFTQRFDYDAERDRSALWDMDIIVKDATFTNGVLQAWRVYARE